MATLSSEVIPKERLSAYQRWELATLEEVDVALADNDAGAECVHAQSRAAGHAEGYAAGLAQAAGERVRLATMLTSMEHAIAGHEQELADAVLDLALTLAGKVLAATIAVRRDLLRPVIAAALEQLPRGPQRIRLSANPADVEVVKSVFAAEHGSEQWQIKPDPAIAIGGFRIESEQCEIDATVATRWGRLLTSLGRNGDWLELPAE